MRIAIIGGTGREGRGLAMRWARTGHKVLIGSRDANKARERAAEVAGKIPSDINGGGLEGGDNDWATRNAEVVLLSVPYAAHAETLRSILPALSGQILIDITVPLVPPKVTTVNVPAGKAAALEAKAIVGNDARVVAALHHVSSVHLADPDAKLDTDTLVCSDDDAARALVIGLCGDLGLRALDAGPLANAIALEALTPVMLYMNKRYKGTGGIRFVGLNT